MPSKETGDDLVSGHGNLANDTTWIIGRRSGEEDDDDAQFWPTDKKAAILVVTPSSVVGDRPEVSLDGIVGMAHRGGAGVRGLGNQPDGRLGRVGSGNGATVSSVMGDREISSVAYRSTTTPEWACSGSAEFGQVLQK